MRKKVSNGFLKPINISKENEISKVNFNLHHNRLSNIGYISKNDKLPKIKRLSVYVIAQAYNAYAHTKIP